MDIDNYNVSQFNQGVNEYLSQMANYNAQVNFYAQQSAEQKQRDENISQLLEMTGLGGMEIIKNFMKTKAWKALSGYVENQLNNNVDIQQIKSELMNKTKSYLRDNFNIDLDKPSNGLLNKALTDLNLSSDDLKSIAQGNTDVLEQKMTQRLQQELKTRTGMTPEQIQQRLSDIQDQAQTVKTQIQQQAQSIQDEAQQRVSQVQQQAQQVQDEAQQVQDEAQQRISQVQQQAQQVQDEAQSRVSQVQQEAQSRVSQVQQEAQSRVSQVQQEAQSRVSQAQQQLQATQDQFETLRDTARTTITPDVMARPTLTFEEQRSRFQSRLNELEAPEVQAPEIKMWRSSQSLIQRGTPLEPLNIPEQQPTELSTTAGDLLGSLGEQGALIGAGIGESYIRDRPTRFATEQATNIGAFIEQTTGKISKAVRGAYQSIKSSLLPTREPPEPANPDTEVIDEERPIELQDMASQAPTETAPAEAPTTTTTTTATTAETGAEAGAVDATLGEAGAEAGAVDATLGEAAAAASSSLAVPGVGEIIEGAIGIAAVGASLYFGLKDLFSSDDDTPPPPEMTVPSYQAGI
jgi:hypothetical protein